MMLSSCVGAMFWKLAVLSVFFPLLQATLAHEATCSGQGDVACENAVSLSRSLLATRRSNAKINETHADELSRSRCCQTNIELTHLIFKPGEPYLKGSTSYVTAVTNDGDRHNPQSWAKSDKKRDRDLNKNSRGRKVTLKDGNSFYRFDRKKPFWGSHGRHTQCLHPENYLKDVIITTKWKRPIKDKFGVVTSEEDLTTKSSCGDIRYQGGGCADKGKCSVECTARWPIYKSTGTLYYTWDRDENHCK